MLFSASTKLAWLCAGLSFGLACGERVLHIDSDFGATSLGWDPLPVCGNGLLEDGERCDDDNRRWDDGCDPDCQPSGVTQVATGRDHTCVVTRRNRLRCFGAGDWGQNGSGTGENLGDDEPASDSGFVDVGAPIEHVSAGWKHTCLLLDGGNVARCFGHNRYAQLGYRNRWTLGDDERPGVADPIELVRPLQQILASEYHTCGLDTAGEVRCWGGSEDGQLGYATTERVFGPPTALQPVRLSIEHIRYLAGSGTHVCALYEPGLVACWGRNLDGELGYAHTENIGDDELPSEVSSVWLSGIVVELVSGAMHNCVRFEHGGVRCWGSSHYGQLGYGDTQSIGDDEHPAEAPLLDLPRTIRQLVAGSGHTCALFEDGTVRCWGKNDDGQLGYGHRDEIGDDEPLTVATPIQLGGPAIALASAWRHTCAILDTGTLRCWGWGALGQLGYGVAENIGDNELPDSAGDVPLFAPPSGSGSR